MEYTRITLRIPVDLHQEITEASERNSRSMNAEIIARLRHANDLDENQTGTMTEERIRELIQEELGRREKKP